MKERRDWQILKMTHKALHQNPWPAYLPLKIKSGEKPLRSSVATQVEVPLESGTFQATASQLFNVLPIELRNYTNFKQFSRQCKELLMNSAKTERGLL